MHRCLKVLQGRDVFSSETQQGMLWMSFQSLLQADFTYSIRPALHWKGEDFHLMSVTEPEVQRAAPGPLIAWQAPPLLAHTAVAWTTLTTGQFFFPCSFFFPPAACLLSSEFFFCFFFCFCPPMYQRKIQKLLYFVKTKLISIPTLKLTISERSRNINTLAYSRTLRSHTHSNSKGCLLISE